MIYLLLSVICSTIIILLFKVFQKKNVNTFAAIVFNYMVCVLVGAPLSDLAGITTSGNFEQWLPFAIILGCLFIFLFYLIGKTAQNVGVAVASVSMKLSLIVPVVLAFTLYNEAFSWLKLIGVLLALVAVVLVSKKENERIGLNLRTLGLPLIVLFGSGICDAIVQYTEIRFFSEGGFEAFTILLFATSSAIGFLVLLGNMSFKKISIGYKEVLAGIVLGIPNYGSIYFVFKTLNVPGWESSVVFPVNNIAIVSASAIAAWLFFSEKLSTTNILGILLAIFSILLIALF